MSATPSRGVPVGEPVGAPVNLAHTQEIRQELDRACAALREARRQEVRAIDDKAHRATARVADAVGCSIDAQLEPALRKFVALAPETRKLVDGVAASLEARVEARATAVVTRLASEEVARRELAGALERKLQRQIDERIGTFWAGLVAGLAVASVGAWIARRVDGRGRG